MFGGFGTIILVVVMRFLVLRQWRAGIGLNVKRRLMLPAIALVIGFVGLRKAGAEVLGSHLALFLAVGVVVTVVAGAVRALTVDSAAVEASELYPGGVRLRARPVTVVADVGGVLLAAAIVLPTLAPAVGLHPAAGAWTLAVALGDLAASGLLLLRSRPAPAVQPRRGADHRS